MGIFTLEISSWTRTVAFASRTSGSLSSQMQVLTAPHLRIVAAQDAGSHQNYTTPTNSTAPADAPRAKVTCSLLVSLALRYVVIAIAAMNAEF